MLFHYGNCKQDISELTSLKFANAKLIKELQEQVMGLLNQNHELKAIYDYQVGDLERRIESLVGQNNCLTDSVAVLAGKNEDLMKQLEHFHKNQPKKAGRPKNERPS